MKISIVIVIVFLLACGKIINTPYVTPHDFETSFNQATIALQTREGFTCLFWGFHEPKKNIRRKCIFYNWSGLNHENSRQNPGFCSVKLSPSPEGDKITISCPECDFGPELFSVTSNSKLHGDETLIVDKSGDKFIEKITRGNNRCIDTLKNRIHQPI